MGGRYERSRNKLLNKFEKVWHGVGKEGDHREFLEISENLRMVSRPETTAELVFWKKVSLYFPCCITFSLSHKVWQRVREATPKVANDPPSELHTKIACKRLR